MSVSARFNKQHHSLVSSNSRSSSSTTVPLCSPCPALAAAGEVTESAGAPPPPPLAEVFSRNFPAFTAAALRFGRLTGDVPDADVGRPSFEEAGSLC